MIGEVLGLLKNPVTSMVKKAEERNIKKEAITALIIAIVIALVSILTTYIGIMKEVKEEYPSYKEYMEEYSWRDETEEEYKKEKKEYKKDLMEDFELIPTFFRSVLITGISICLIAGILFVISRVVKSPKDYIEMISMVNGAFVIYLIGFLLNTIFSFIYAPIGTIAQTGALIYAIISVSNAFRESIQVEDVDKLAKYSSIVLTVVFAVLVIIAMNYLDSLIGGSLLSSLL